jgi:hypothetical protein
VESNCDVSAALDFGEKWEEIPVLNTFMPVGLAWTVGAASGRISHLFIGANRKPHNMRHTIGATWHSTFSLRAHSRLELVPWFPTAAPDNSAHTGERLVAPWRDGEASQSRAQRPARALLGGPFEEDIEGAIDGRGRRVPTVKDLNGL